MGNYFCIDTVVTNKIFQAYIICFHLSSTISTEHVNIKEQKIHAIPYHTIILL